MSFHTWTFLLFFLVTFAGYLALRPTRFWLPWILAASYFFYGWWDPWYALLILYSTVLDYAAVSFMDRSRSRGARRGWLWVSIVNNLSVLAFFKYGDFVISNLNNLGLALKPARDLMPFGWEYLLPVGISFYTFQSMAYTIDFYRGHIPRERNFLRFATFVSFFPQLVAGPIERSRHLLPQFKLPPVLTSRHFTDGASLFLVGLFKKLALSNYLALYVDQVYASPADQGSAALLLATFCFAWQIYFDFSGYTDMARGIARMMGFNLMPNFNHPYLATGLGDFWGRWHISLSTWFRDYVYLPLGGNRGSTLFTWRNLLLVFLISGLWHGPAWHFVIWGALHAFGVILTRALERSARYRERVPVLAKRLWTFAFVCFAWIFFRAESTADAWLIISRITSGLWQNPLCPLLLLVLVLLGWVYQFAVTTERGRALLQHSAARVLIATSMIIYLFFCSTKGGTFIYFQF